MAIKTNKSYSKRLRVTKRGKILARKPGHNHFNAKERRRLQLKKKGFVEISIKPKARSRFLVNM
jgi:ribosomal protein L35